MMVTEINKVYNSHFLPCRSCSNSIKVTWTVQLRCDATRFSWPDRPAVLHDFFRWLLFFI